MAAAGPIVVGHDGTARARDALALADLLASAGDAALVIVRVIPVVDAGLRVVAEAELAAVDASGLTAQATTEVVAAPSAAEGLRQVAERERAALIVVGSTHRAGLGRAVVGSVASRLTHEPRCAVAVAPKDFASGKTGLRTIGAAFDMSPESKAAVRLAAEVATNEHAGLRLVAVEPSAARHFADAAFGDAFAGFTAGPGARLLTGLARELLYAVPEEVRASARLLQGDPAECLVEEAGRGIDLMVTGSRGHGAVAGAVLGSVSRHLVEHASCPVIVAAQPSLVSA